MTHDALTCLLFLATGLAGAFVGACARDGGIELPRIYRTKTETGETAVYLDPGFIPVGMLGAAVAAWIDGRWYTAGAYGVAVGYVGLPIVRQVLGAWLRAKGIDFTAPTPEALGPPAVPQKGTL